MAGFEVTRLVQNPLGAAAPAGERGEIVRVGNGWGTIYLDPAEFERATEGGLLRMLAEADRRRVLVSGASTPAGGRSVSAHHCGSGTRSR